MERKTIVYEGSELHVSVAGDAAAGFYIATQALRMNSRGGYCSVPSPSAHFRLASHAFADAFARLRNAADVRVRSAGQCARHETIVFLMLRLRRACCGG